MARGDEKWVENGRRRARETALLKLDEVRKRLENLEKALIVAKDSTRRFVLQNEILRTRKKLREINANLRDLKVHKYKASIEKVEKKYRDANAVRDADSGTAFRPLQGGLPK